MYLESEIAVDGPKGLPKLLPVKLPGSVAYCPQPFQGSAAKMIARASAKDLKNEGELPFDWLRELRVRTSTGFDGLCVRSVRTSTGY